MQKSITTLLLGFSLAANVYAQGPTSGAPVASIDISLEERVNALDRNAQQLNLRLEDFEKQHHKGCKILVVGILGSALGTVMLANQDTAGKEPALAFGGLGLVFTTVGTYYILDAPRRLKVPVEK